MKPWYLSRTIWANIITGVVLVAGAQDPYCSVADLEAFARTVPGSRVVTVDGANHFFFGKLFPLGEALRAWVQEWAPD